MKPERASLWIRMFAELVVVWPFLEPTRDRVRVWDAALSDLSEGQLREGVARLIANHGSGTPTPGELRDAVLGPLTWQTVRHQVDGRVMGKRQARALARNELPAPQSLIDLDRTVPALPGKAGELVSELAGDLAEKMKPGRPPEQGSGGWVPLERRGPEWCICGYRNRAASSTCESCSRTRPAPVDPS